MVVQFDIVRLFILRIRFYLIFIFFWLNNRFMVSAKDISGNVFS